MPTTIATVMPVAFAGRAEAAESLVAYEAYKIYGIRDAADKETESRTRIDY